MDYLVQNTSQTPIFLQIVRNRNGKPSSEGTIVFESDNTVTKISEETYNEMLKNAFYRSKIEQGVLVVLNAGSGVNLDAKVSQALQTKELGYARYVALVSKIESSGGLSEPRLKPFLDRDGMPSIELCRKNLGDCDPQTIETYRERYLVEKQNGLHEGNLVIPGGASFRSSNEKVNIKEEAKEEPAVETPKTEDSELDSLSMEQLKGKADELGVAYNEDISFSRLLNRVKKQMNDK